MITIFHFLPDLHIGGVLRLLQYNINALAKKDIKHVVIYFNPNVEGEHFLSDPTIIKIRIPNKGILSTPAILTKLFALDKQYKPDILHSHLPFDTRFSFLLSFFSKARLVITLHFVFEGERETFQNRINRWIFMRALRRAQRLIAVSNFVKSNQATSIRHKIDVIYSGVIDHGFKSPAINKFVMNGDPNILCVGRSHAVKGHVHLIALTKRLMMRYSDIKVFLFTKNIERSDAGKQLLRLIDQESLSNNLIIVNDINDPDLILSLYAQADVFVLPSLSETLSLSAIEALSFGVPVVASDVGGIPEVVRHDVNGFLFAVGDMTSASNYVERIVDDIAIKQRLSANARTSFKQNFDLEVFEKKLYQFYKDLFGNRAFK